MKSIQSINNYLYNYIWYGYAGKDTSVAGTYSKLLILFDEIVFENDYVICTDILRNDSSAVLLSYNKHDGIEHLGDGKYKVDLQYFIPLKEITPPKKIQIGDFFYASTFGCGGTRFKRINEFTTNPWSDKIDCFINNSIYYFKGPFGEMINGRKRMLKANQVFNKLVSGHANWI